MTVTDLASPALVALPVPVEPVELRRRLRTALLDGAAWEERFGFELGVGDALWSAWGAALSDQGLTREQFAAVVRGYRRELWFWVLGDRIWAQVATGLAGRLVRRVPRPELQAAALSAATSSMLTAGGASRVLCTVQWLATASNAAHLSPGTPSGTLRRTVIPPTRVGRSAKS